MRMKKGLLLYDLSFEIVLKHYTFYKNYVIM